MSRKVLSKEEFVRRVMADFEAKKKAIASVKQAAPKKRKYTCKRKKYPYFEVIEKTILYA